MPNGSSSQPVRGDAPASYAVRMRGVDFSYCSVPASARLYDAFELDVEQGSVMVVMGPSGSGKSTLGKMMARIIRPTAGRIDWSPEFHQQADVVYMDQHAMNSVFPWQTVRRNLEYPLEKLGWSEPEAKARIAYLADLFRLEPLMDSLPAKVSGGELQRLALARCLSWRPELVILDEPLSGLDRTLKSDISLALSELAIKDGITLVLITHSVSDAMAIGTRYVIIGDRPVRIISDLRFKSPRPWEAGPIDRDTMEAALIAGIRDGLV